MSSPPGTRSKTGVCERCHRRKVRCDKSRPQCAACARAKAPCRYSETEYQLRRHNAERLEQRIRDLQAENENLSARLARSEARQRQYAVNDRPMTYATPASLQADTISGPSGNSNGEIANQVINLSLSAGGGRDFLGSTSGLFLADLLQSHTQAPSLSVYPFRQSTSVSGGNIQNGISTPQAACVLPPKSYASEILDAYYSHDHLWYPIVSVKELSRALDAVYDADCTEKIDPVDGFFIDMCLAIGTAQVYKFNWNGVYDAETHYTRALTRLVDVLCQGGLVGLQALLLICQYRMGTTSHNTSTNVWHLIGVAARTCFELGLHKASTYEQRSGEEQCHHSSDDGSGADRDAKEDLEMKRLCFWSLVAMDRVTSLTLGRPLAVQLEDIEVDLPNVGPPPDIQLFCSSLAPALYGTAEWRLRTSIFVHIVRYRVICGKILNLLHRDTKHNGNRSVNYEEIRDGLVHELQSWREGITRLPLVSTDTTQPASPASGSSFRCEEWYQLLYHNGILMLFRPSPCLFDAPRNIIALQHMFDSSQAAMNSYANLHRTRKINYSWVTLHSIFIAGLSYIYALRTHFQHLRNESAEGARLQSTPSIGQVVNDTRGCSKVLVAVSERWAMARNCSEVFDKISDAVVADVVEAQMRPAPPNEQAVSIADRSTGMAMPSNLDLTGTTYPQAINSTFNMTVDDTLRDCYGDLQNLCYDQYHSDAIAQLSQEWLYGIGEVNSRYY
ncbi:hypothetical protein DL771_003827 [Monosporascus sp. 5C6A]|nr:hypothetical protein DL771_003827 [Monosporascus sp. 5C6A]